MDRATFVDQLRLKFPGSDSLLFRDLSISIEQGEKVLLLGPSGCGKSTLLQVLAGLIPHSIDIPMKAEEKRVPDTWGYVFQDPDSQFCMPYVDEEIAFVLENLQIPREQMKGRIQELVQLVGLQLDSLHTDIHALSGGMKQRLAIATALASDPDVLFLDEPTAMIDVEGTESIWGTIKEIMQEKTVIIVEHKIEHFLDFVDRIVLFNDNGEIIADGSEESIFQACKPIIHQHGIWHPNIWEEYSQTLPKRDDEPSQKVLLELHELKGFRHKEEKIYVEKAYVHEGEWIVIMGENGAGKSTLLHAIMRFIKTSGDCHLYGQPISKIKELHHEVAFVFQNPEFQFVTNSVFQEVAYGLQFQKIEEEEMYQIVDSLLKTFRLEHVKDQHPYQLSMGQKRRLSVAASIVHDQNLLLLDEPTFGQDANNTFALLELLEQLRKQGTTIMMVTHDENIAQHFATRKWDIHEGCIVRDERINRKVVKEGAM